MIIILKRNPDKEKVDIFIDHFKQKGFEINYSQGENTTLIGLIGDTLSIDIDLLRANEIVEDVKRISEPFKFANRKFHAEDALIQIGDAAFGAGRFSVIAGPCSVESYEQIIEVSKRVKASGAKFLRGGAFKPRTSPYAFQGLKAEGIELMLAAKKETGLPIVIELTSITHLDLFNDVDVIQVGARNMQNFEMLRQLGKSDKPILLKRGLSNSIEELLMSAEYILAGGNSKVILCERGIRTFETATRNTLDISAVPLLKKMSHLPVIVDPSHATGISSLVRPLSKAAVVVGADGIMIEVHPHPSEALCDGAQSITPDEFDVVMGDVKKLCEMENKIWK
jgi:3-deoxy-7-phosphoheptulonate synthase